MLFYKNVRLSFYMLLARFRLSETCLGMLHMNMLLLTNRIKCSSGFFCVCSLWRLPSL